ncbi:MAG: hypothetical protein WD894_21880 [Pirellulales bacterium]
MTCPLRSLDHSSRETLIRALTEQMRQCETARRHGHEAAVSTGYAVLDRALCGGLHRGTLVEWLAHDGGSGATTLALAAARQACGETGTLVVVDRRRTFYPLAAVACGIDLSRLILARPQHDRDETWAIDQALRSGGASAVLAWPEKLDDHLFRRLQLAAEAGDTLGLLLRPARALAEPSWAEVRWLVEPLPSVPSREGDAPRRVKLSLLRSSGGAAMHCPQFVVGLDDRSGRRIESQGATRIQRQKTA